MNPYKPVKDFEAAVCEYTHATYCVTTNSCTMALLLAVAWHLRTMQPGVKSGGLIEIPKLTYVGVPMSIIHAGGKPVFLDRKWAGYYRLDPLPVWDSARWFSSGMYSGVPRDIGSMLCVSFHASKTLGDTQGGAILHDDHNADAWLRRARFDGRTEGVAPKDDKFQDVGWHCYMSPDVAARLTMKLHSLPRHNASLPNDDYPDLSKMEIFK